MVMYGETPKKQLEWSVVLFALKNKKNVTNLRLQIVCMKCLVNSRNRELLKANSTLKKMKISGLRLFLSVH